MTKTINPEVWDPILAQIAHGHSHQLDHSQTKLERVGMKGIDGQKLAPILL